MRWLAGLLLFASVRLGAAEVAETFSTKLKFANGTAIWNSTLGVVHPTLRVVNYTAGSPAPIALDVGDGSDGAFIPSRYSEFSQNGDVSGNKIRLDLSAHPQLKVTEFLLEDGWVLEPVGNASLIIRSLSTVKIRGEIWCHGQDATVSTVAVGGTGGAGRCGGATGGNGGDAGQDGADGGDSTAPVTGGLGGNYTGGASVGGGGGGAWSTTSTAGNGTGSTGVAASPGYKGNSFSDPEFDTVAGGAGGGGGGAGTTAAGGGGGGGGGVVIIHSVGDFELGSSTNANIGFIYASGGNGSDSSGNGGPGGGGGGGSVEVFSGGTIRIYSNSGSAASQAVGGRNPAPTVGAAGSLGRSWFTSIGYSSAGFYDPSEEAPIIAGNMVQYNSSAQSVETVGYDLGNTLAEVTAISVSPSSADFSLQFAGSTDNFVSDSTGWTSSLAALSEKRYVKFKLTITTSSVTAPTLPSSVTITYVPGVRSNFEFKSAAGCARVSDSKSGFGSLTLPMFLLMALIYWRLYLSRNERKKTAKRQSLSAASLF